MTVCDCFAFNLFCKNLTLLESILFCFLNIVSEGDAISRIRSLISESEFSELVKLEILGILCSNKHIVFKSSSEEEETRFLEYVLRDS